jgi:hypothetical protein
VITAVRARILLQLVDDVVDVAAAAAALRLAPVECPPV